MQDYTKIYSQRYPDVFLKVIPGHFVTPNSHINYYIDMTTTKTRRREARAVAAALAEPYSASTTIDTIICMDNTEVIGAFLADELTKAGVLSQNAHRTMYIMTPEYNLTGQMIFRENTQMMIKDKNVLVLCASATTGRTLAAAMESVAYYGGKISGISAVFSVISAIAGHPVNALFSKADLADYANYKSDECALCKAGKPIDAIANGFGYSRVQ